MSPRLIPRDQSFYALYDAQAATAAEAARVLEADLREFEDPTASSRALQKLEHDGDEINHEIVRRLESTFVIPFEREDMHALAGALDDVIDLAEKVGDMLVLYHVIEPPPGAADQAVVLAQACDIIIEAIAALPRPSEARKYPPQIHALEKAGDALRRRLIQHMFDDPIDIVAAIVADDIYDGIEDAIDATDRVGRAIERIVLAPGGPW